MSSEASSGAGGTSSQPEISNICSAAGAWLELWVPCVAFAHIFAFSWLLLAFLKMRPQQAATLRRVWAWTWAWVRSRKREQMAPATAPSSESTPGAAAVASTDVQLQQRLPPLAMAPLPLAVGPDGATQQARRAPAVPYPGPTEAGVAAAEHAHPPPPLRPGAVATAALVGGDVEAGASPGCRLWVPPLQSVPPSEPGSAMAQGSEAGITFPADNFQVVTATPPPPAHVPRRWTALGVPKVDKDTTTAAELPPLAAAPVAASGAADGAPTPGAAGSVKRRTVTMHHAVTEADLAKANGVKGARKYGDLSDLGMPPPPRHISRHTREIMHALAAQGAAPDLRVVRRISSNVRRICIEWRDLGCVYDTSSGPKTVLQGVYGRAVPGDLLGLLGPSGAGKSTLLDVLAARKRVGRLSGHVLVDGKPRDDGAFVRRSAYVPQDDHFIPALSAWEVITFYASLVLPAATSPAGRRKRCTEVLAAMGLGRQSGTLVGGTLPGGLVLRGLSGGERKRLAIATGIVAAPSALLLDEPTSGLDAAAALGVMQYMHALAQAGHVVLASVHQPRAAIWSMFTQVVVLSRGRMMYSGDRAGAVPWFTSGLGYSYDPQRHGVASDWIMDLVNTTFKKPRRIYGRMMTTAADVDAAADAFLRRYKELRQEDQMWDEQDGNRPSLPYGSNVAKESSAARSHKLEPAGPGAGNMLQLYDSIDSVRVPTAAAAATVGESPVPGVDMSPPVLVHRGSTERPSSAFEAQRSRLAATAAGAAGGDDGSGHPTCGATVSGGGGGGSVSATAGSPPLLPATPRSNSLGSAGGAAAAATASPDAVSNLISPGPRGRSSGSPHLFGVSRGWNGRSSGGGSGGGGCERPSGELSPVAKHFRPNCNPTGTLDSQSRQQALPPPRRGILRISAPRSADSGQLPGGITDAAAKAVVAWSSGGATAADRRLQRKRERQLRLLQQPALQPGWLRQVRVLTWRELMAMTRNPADVAGRMLIFCWIALVVGLIFYSVGNYFEAIRSRLDVMFIETCVLLLLPYVYMSLYTADKQYYTADLSAKLYSPSAYYTAKVLAVLPFGVMSMLVFSFTIYGMAGLRRSGSALAEHGLLATLAYLIASQVLYAAAVATPNQDTAFMVAIAWTAVNILMSNYLIRYDDMSQIWLTKVLRWFSVMMWTFQGMAAAEYRNQFYSCASGFGTPVLATLPSYLPGNPAVSFAPRILGDPGPNCAINTNKILIYFGMTEPFWRLAVILAGYLGMLHIITYAALRLTAGRERR
ncbi:hypothetical protein Vafri_1186 [Volvox africanus]|nr:hypothetical protein Vafri_1186 [Volvox africanus]